MNLKNINEFKLFEGNTFVASFSKLSIAISSNVDDPSKADMAYVAEDLSLKENFHFLNTSSNKYFIKFKESSSQDSITYVLGNCSIDSITSIKEDVYSLDRIQGVFETLTTDKIIHEFI